MRLLQHALVVACAGVLACAARGPEDGAGEAHVHAGGAPAAAADQRPPAQPHAAHHPPPAQVHAHPVELPATAGPGYTAADVRFMQMMMGHHAQAVTMSALAPSRGAASEVLRLAQKIDISQRDEIAMMRAWLLERGQAVPDAAHMQNMQMPGMLTPAQLARLAATRGREFDRLFLTLMIEHHEGAVLMVDELFASPGAAQDSEIFRFATDVAADQGDEIAVMHYMLEMLAARQ